jgi:hypothetical protein
VTEVYTLTANPAGASYFDLLRWVADRSAHVGFVVSPDRELSTRARTLLRAFEARGADRREVTEWPGTTLRSGRALRYILPAIPNMDIVLGAAADLFSWQEPDLPEDLFFLRENGDPILSSIALDPSASPDPC